MEHILKGLGSKDWEKLLGQPANVIERSKVFHWTLCSLPEGIRRRWGNWDGLLEAVEGAARQMNKKICDAHSPGRVAEYTIPAYFGAVQEVTESRVQSPHNAPQTLV